METLTFAQVKKINDEQFNLALTNGGVFFAFSKEQFEEGKAKHPIQGDDKYVSFGYGGYILKSKKEALEKALEEINTNFRKVIQDNNFQDKEILYHLHNHECYYTGDIEDVVDNLNGIYTREEISKVFYANASEEWR